MPTVVNLNIDYSDREEVNTLEAFEVTHKSTKPHLIGDDTKPHEGLLRRKLRYSLILTACSLICQQIQKANISSVICQLSKSAKKAKNHLIEVFNEMYKYTSITVSEEQEIILESIIVEYDEALVRANQRDAIFYDILKGRLSETGLDVDPLLDLHSINNAVPPPTQSTSANDTNGIFTQMTPVPRSP